MGSSSWGGRAPPEANSKAINNILVLNRFWQGEDGRKNKREATAPANPQADALSDIKDFRRASSFSQMITRRWRPGDVYAPHDLSDVEMMKWKKRSKPAYDAFDVLDMNPLDHYRVRSSLR
jgi:hypothetical protein